MLHAIVAVRIRLPSAQLAFALTGLGDVVAVPVITLVLGADAVPDRQPVSEIALSVIDCVVAVCVSPGLMVALPLSWQAAPRGAASAEKVANRQLVVSTSAAPEPMTSRRFMRWDLQVWLSGLSRNVLMSSRLGNTPFTLR